MSELSQEQLLESFEYHTMMQQRHERRAEIFSKIPGFRRVVVPYENMMIRYHAEMRRGADEMMGGY